MKKHCFFYLFMSIILMNSVVLKAVRRRPWEYTVLKNNIKSVRLDTASDEEKNEIQSIVVSLTERAHKQFYFQCLLKRAVIYDNPEWVCPLIYLGAQANKKNKRGKSPLYYAVEMNNENMVYELLVCSKIEDLSRIDFAAFVTQATIKFDKQRRSNTMIHPDAHNDIEPVLSLLTSMRDLYTKEN